MRAAILTGRWHFFIDSSTRLPGILQTCVFSSTSAPASLSSLRPSSLTTLIPIFSRSWSDLMWTASASFGSITSNRRMPNLPGLNFSSMRSASLANELLRHHGSAVRV